MKLWVPLKMSFLQKQTCPVPDTGNPELIKLPDSRLRGGGNLGLLEMLLYLTCYKFNYLEVLLAGQKEGRDGYEGYPEHLRGLLRPNEP